MTGRLEHVFALDRRSLALFRLGLGAALLVDLAARLPDLRAFYTDDGVLPREAWLEISEPWRWSLHLTTGSALGQAVAFTVAAAAALGLMLGVRARLCALVSYVLLLSLTFRNPLVADFGDWTLQAMLLWAMFLPLCTPRWPWQRFEGPARVRSLATAALLAQLLVLYSSSAAHKVKVTGGWAAGTVLPTVLQLRATSTAAGLWLAAHPKLCAAFSYATLVLELLGPLLLFLPWRNGAARLVAVCSFTALHLSIGLFLRLGLFPFFSLVPWLAMLPEAFWKHALERRAERVGGAASPPSGVSEDALPGWARASVIVLLTVVTAWAMVSASPAARRLERLEPVAGALGLAHVWSMFAGVKYQDGWFRAPAVLASGARVDLLTGDAPADSPPADPAHVYGDRRWSNYQRQLFGPVAPGLWPAWANWLCTRHRGAADPTVQVQLERVVENAGRFETEVMVSGSCRR